MQLKATRMSSHENNKKLLSHALSLEIRGVESRVSRVLVRMRHRPKNKIPYTPRHCQRVRLPRLSFCLFVYSNRTVDVLAAHKICLSITKFAAAFALMDFLMVGFHRIRIISLGGCVFRNCFVRLLSI